MKTSHKLADWLDSYWTALVILLGVIFTLFLALFKPHTYWANF